LPSTRNEIPTETDHRVLEKHAVLPPSGLAPKVDLHSYAWHFALFGTKTLEICPGCVRPGYAYLQESTATAFLR